MQKSLVSRVREVRNARGWSQQQLAEAAEISRAGVSAIESGRLTPSVEAALRLAAALGCRAEELFMLPGKTAASPEWAWQVDEPVVRYWQADVAGRRLLYPVERTFLCAGPHDGVATDKRLEPRAEVVPVTLVMTCCDPAVGLLAAELARTAGVRLLPFFRSSRRALQLLKQRSVHVAGLHLSHGGSEGNKAAVRTELGEGYRLVRVAAWEEGLVTSTDRRPSSVTSLLRSKPRWVGREVGSGARQCLDELLGGRATVRRMASDHYGVVEAVRSGWADAGVSLRLVAEEAALHFLPVRKEAYDLCFPEELVEDSRIQALLTTLRSSRYRQLLGDLSGYNSQKTGEIIA